MIPGWLLDAADEFWAEAKEPPQFPRDLTLPALRAFVIDPQVIPGLRISGIKEWFAKRGCSVRIEELDRRLRGCLTAIGGASIIFLDGSSDPADCRYTFAHEVAHFLVDYHIPRKRTIERLGPSIVDVLDGRREPSAAERFGGALNKVPLGLHLHLLDRIDPTALISKVESRADQLAWELLAPDEVLERRYGKLLLSETELCQGLINEFGFPGPEAVRYARRWLEARKGQRPLLRIV